MPSSLLSNYHIAFAVTPSDTANLESPASMLYVGSAGNLNVALSGEGQGFVLMRNIPAGTFFEASVLAVAQTDTTASNIVAFV
jgi:hypothetical protein